MRPLVNTFCNDVPGLVSLRFRWPEALEDNAAIP